MGFFDGSVDDAQLATQRAIRAEQHRAQLIGTPLGRLDEFADEELWGLGAAHPYHNAVQTLPEYSHDLDRESILAFHDRWMNPGHARLVVVGDVDSQAVFGLVARYW